MQKIITLLCLAGLAVVMAGCKDEDQNTYQYLVTHPMVLKKKMDACVNLSKTASNVEKQRCEIVTNASTKFMTIVAEQQIDAEKFGIRVLAIETAYANAKIKVKQLEADLAKAKANATLIDVAAIHKLEEDLAAAKKDCEAKQMEVRMLLAVVGVSTPN